MRGDLVYEKLGEIGEDLITDALPDAVPLVQVDSLTASPRPPRGAGWRKAGVIAACVLLAGLLAAGGGAWLLREPDDPWDTDAAEESDTLDTSGISPENTVQTPHDSEEDPPETVPELHDYEGKLLIYDTSGTHLLYVGNKPEHEDEIREIIAILNRAIKPDMNPVAAVCHFELTVGDTALGVVFGTLVDQTNGGRYDFAEGDWERFYQLIKAICGYFPDGLMEDPAGIVYESGIRYHGDAYEISTVIHNSMYALDDLVLMHQHTGYMIPLQAVYHDDSYVCTIPEDAPTGYYLAVASFGTPYSDRKFTIRSHDPAVNLRSHDKESAYTFDYDRETADKVYNVRDLIQLDILMTNLGDELYRYGGSTVIYPKATLVSESGYSVDMFFSLVTEDGYQIRYLPSDTVTVAVELPPKDLPDLPCETYDLILSFEGHEQTFENVLEITDTPVLHRGDSYGLFVSQTELSQFALKQGDCEIPFINLEGYPIVYIPTDAPAGRYDLVEQGLGGAVNATEGYVYISDAETKLNLRSDLEKQIVRAGDAVDFNTYTDIVGPTIRLFMPYDSLDIDAVLVSKDGSYTLQSLTAPDGREPNNYEFSTGTTFAQSKTFFIPDDIPAGDYDLVLSFRGFTETYKDMVTVEKP